LEKESPISNFQHFLKFYLRPNPKKSNNSKKKHKLDYKVFIRETEREMDNDTIKQKRKLKENYLLVKELLNFFSF
jgi:hypothetical protein